MLRRASSPLALTVLLAAPAAAPAQEVEEVRADTRVRGALVVSFASDPATCAPVGRCGISGTVSLVPGTGTDVVLHLPRRGSRRVFGGADLGSSYERSEAVVSEVRRDTPDGPRVCRDRHEIVTSLRASGAAGDVRFRFDVLEDLLVSRCGAPVMDDVRALLPVVRTTFATVRRGRTTLRASTDRPFTAGGFTGRVRSDLRFVVGRTRARREVVGPGPLRPVPDDFAVEQATGGLDLAAGPPRDCARLDACDLTAELSVRAAPGRSSGGYLGRSGMIAWEDGGGSMSTVVSRPGAEPCRDTRPLHVAFLRLEPNGPSSLDVGYVPAFPRTRCPGPVFDLLGEEGAVARGTVMRSELEAPRATLRVTAPAAADAGGYRVAGRSADLTVVVRRIRR